MTDDELIDALHRLYHRYYADRVRKRPDWNASQASFFDFLAWANAERKTISL